MLFYTIGLAIQRFQRQVRRASSTSLPCNSFLFEFHVMTNLSSQSNHASSVFHMSRKRPAHTIKIVAIFVRLCLTKEKMLDVQRTATRQSLQIKKKTIGAGAETTFATAVAMRSA
jgi:hypothetical protein